MGDWFETALKILVVLGAVGMVSGMLGLARRIIRGGPSTGRLWLESRLQQRRDPAADQELAELRQMVERLNGDVLELQERLDFAERMLAQQRERQALPDR